MSSPRECLSGALSQRGASHCNEYMGPSRQGDVSSLLPLSRWLWGSCNYGNFRSLSLSHRPTRGSTGSIFLNIRGHALQQRGAHSDYSVGLSPYSDPNNNVGRPEYISVIYKVVSRKLLNSEVCGNASGNGNSLFTFPTASGILICTNTEGPSRDRAPSFYILIFYWNVVWRSWLQITTHTQTSIYLLFALTKTILLRVLHLHIKKWTKTEAYTVFLTRTE